MPPSGIPNDLHRRLAKLEATTRGPQIRKVVCWAIEGPKGLPEGAAAAFLRECGHDLKDEDHNIIRIMVATGRDLPLKDITHEYGRQSPGPASVLHMQHGRG